MTDQTIKVYGSEMLTSGGHTKHHPAHSLTSQDIYTPDNSGTNYIAFNSQNTTQNQLQVKV